MKEDCFRTFSAAPDLLHILKNRKPNFEEQDFTTKLQSKISERLRRTSSHLRAFSGLVGLLNSRGLAVFLEERARHFAPQTLNTSNCVALHK
eukprot:9754693-Karenia_brevis.AAC.1